MTLEHNLNIDVFDLVTATPADPAPQGYGTLTVPANSRIQPLSISCTFAASANAMNRLPYVYIYSGTKVVQIAIAKAIITANETIDVHFALGTAGEDVTGTHNKQYAALPDKMYALVGDHVRIFSFGMHAADQISNVIIRYKQWIAEN